MSLQQISPALIAALEEQLARALGERVSLAAFAEHKGVADETLKLAARGARGEAIGVVLYAPEIAPRLIARGCERGRAARAALGEELGRVVVTARAEGEHAGRTWALMPQARVLGHGLAARAERRWLAGALLAWLREVARRAAGAADESARSCYGEALAYAESEPALGDEIRAGARAARARIAAAAWRPRHVVMHGDLWAGNVLGAPSAAPFSRRFVLIDWDTSRVSGFPILDLVRAARSFGVSRSRLGREIAAHSSALGWNRDVARGALIAALGHTGLARENFPLARYAEMARGALASFDAAATGS
ncbi:MAG: phosphotransferase [Deltaproteobacteria bacterium]|nr:phosphotransferase [Deltaproteobacteria bacterium]